MNTGLDSKEKPKHWSLRFRMFRIFNAYFPEMLRPAVQAG